VPSAPSSPPAGLSPLFAVVVSVLFTPNENEGEDADAGAAPPDPNLKPPAAVESVDPALDDLCVTPKLNEGIVVAAVPPASDEGPATFPNKPFTVTGARLNDSCTGRPASLISAIAESEGPDTDEVTF